MRRYRHWFVLTALATFLLDQGSKAVVRAMLLPSSSVPLISNLVYLTHTQNTGAAFGLFSGAAPFLVVIALLVVALLLWLGKQGFDRRRMAVAMGMMLGGALGNLSDRLRFGAVTDFIDLRVWPIFNFADMALTFGAFLLLWWSIVDTSPKSGETPPWVERAEQNALAGGERECGAGKP